MAGWTGLEPGTSDVTGERSRWTGQRLPEIPQRVPSTRPDRGRHERTRFDGRLDTPTAQRRPSAVGHRVGVPEAHLLHSETGAYFGYQRSIRPAAAGFSATSAGVAR